MFSKQYLVWNWFTTVLSGLYSSVPTHLWQSSTPFTKGKSLASLNIFVERHNSQGEIGVGKLSLRWKLFMSVQISGRVPWQACNDQVNCSFSLARAHCLVLWDKIRSSRYTVGSCQDLFSVWDTICKLGFLVWTWVGVTILHENCFHFGLLCQRMASMQIFLVWYKIWNSPENETMKSLGKCIVLTIHYWPQNVFTPKTSLGLSIFTRELTCFWLLTLHCFPELGSLCQDTWASAPGGCSCTKCRVQPSSLLGH